MAIASRINIPTGLLVLRRRLQAAFGLLTKVGVFLLIAVGGGTLSSWYAVEKGMPFNTESQGPWVRWTGAGRPDADPYSRTHFSNRTQLLFNANQSARFEAATDNRGRRLHSSCDYLVEGRNISAPWWSLAAFDSSGQLIPNAAGRFSFNSGTVAYSPDSSFAIRLSREARPYNWLPTTQAGQIVVIFEAQKKSGRTDVLDRTAFRLPTIKRLSCR